MFQNATYFTSCYATEKYLSLLKIDWHKDGGFWKHILEVGRSVFVSLFQLCVWNVNICDAGFNL